MRFWLVVALALTACKAPQKAPAIDTQPPSLCTLVSYEDADKALGAPPVGATDTADAGNLNPGCSWMAATQSIGAEPRMLVFTVWRKSALDLQGAPLSGAELYAHNVADITREYGTVAPLYGVGDEAVIGVSAAAQGGLDGNVVARKGADVLTMQLHGADRATFEELARKVAKAM